jgi:hypothetical protein
MSKNKRDADFMARGAAALMAAQGADGGWHSTTYGSLRSGAGVTALAIYAMSHAPPDVRRSYDKRLRLAFQFLLPGLKSRGAVAAPDGTFDYPTYASACLLVAAQRIDLGAEQAALDLLAEHLIAAQLDEDRQFPKDNPNHGGWDLMGADRVVGATSGTNISLACFALEGLATVKTRAADEARAKALKWLALVQHPTPDGGFFFTPERASEGNKAQWTDEDFDRPRSYGTATADGLRALLYAGAPPDDARVRAAAKWLDDHEALDEVPGFEDTPAETGWATGLRYYYFFTLGKALRLLSSPPARRQTLLAAIAAEQRPGGAWKNPSSRMREDDALIATSLALIAASECL